MLSFIRTRLLLNNALSVSELSKKKWDLYVSGDGFINGTILEFSSRLLERELAIADKSDASKILNNGKKNKMEALETFLETIMQQPVTQH